jgi:hypothetical protein
MKGPNFLECFMADPEASPPQRTPEQHEAVRRRTLPVAICGIIVALVGLTLLMSRTVDEVHPPSLLGVYLSFCAMMMGIGILFYARGTPGTRAATVACMLAIGLGLAGTFVFARQSVVSRTASEQRELANVSAIANAAAAYAKAHGGAYPLDIAVLLEQKLIAPEVLHSPYERLDRMTVNGIEDALAKQWPSRADMLKEIQERSDYEYWGGDLRLPSATAPATNAALGANTRDLFAQIIVACRHYPIERSELSLAMSDGTAQFVTLPDFERLFAASNQAREALGIAPMRPPQAVDKALKLEHQETKSNP